MPTEDEYRAMAAEAMARLPDATTEAERVQIKRANAAYLKLATHSTEAAARADLKPPRITNEKQAYAKRLDADKQWPTGGRLKF